jgi:predicted transcriptional regulator
VTAQTISQATGIPRETVRRKLKLLLERGVIVEKTRGGYVMKPGFIQTPENMDIVDRGMRDTLVFMNECVKLGLVRWIDDETD